MGKDNSKFKDQMKDQKDEAKGLSSTSSDEIKAKGTGKKEGFKGKKFSRKKTNDPSWYVANPSIVKDVANLPFAVYNGVTYKQFNQVSLYGPDSDSNMKVTIPGVATYKYIPWYGTATPTSSLNLTMRALYSFVRHVNSGRTNYEAPDLMIYIMAMDNVYLLIHEIKRLLRLAYLYVLENRDIPNRVFSALGIDADDLVSNLANYRAQLNTRIAKANSLAVPANFNLFKRRAVMGSVVLTDEPNRPTQLILPASDGYFMYDGTASTGSTLQFVTPYQEPTTADSALAIRGGDNAFYRVKTPINNYFQLLDRMLTALLSDEDINIMSGDIIKAYGDNLYKLPFLEPNEVQDIIHDENLLLQFSNSTVLDIPGASFARYNSNNASLGMTQKHNAIVFETSSAATFQDLPIITQRNGSLVARCTINTSTDFIGKRLTMMNQIPLVCLENSFIDTTEANSITPENVLEWSRLAMCFSQNRHNSEYWDLEAGVEMGLGWMVAQPIETYSLTTNLINSNNVDRTLCVQWFQFGRRNSLDTKVQMPTPSTIPNHPNLFITIVTNEKLNFNATTTDNIDRKYNTMYASKFIEGLSYGPRAYEVGGMVAVATGIVNIRGDMAIGKLGEKTAIASRMNIVAMHDAALLGLISSPYITTSK